MPIINFCSVSVEKSEERSGEDINKQIKSFCFSGLNFHYGLPDRCIFCLAKTSSWLKILLQAHITVAHDYISELLSPASPSVHAQNL
jgi:hypothetical protein